MMDLVATTPPPRSNQQPRPGSNAQPPATDGPTVDAEVLEGAERLRLATTRLARILRQETHTGLTPTQVAALATLQRLGPVAQRHLAEAERISAPTATKVVDKLVQAGLVERRGDPTDRRVTLLAVTEAGHDLLATTRRHKTAWLATHLGTLSAQDRTTLMDAVDVLERLVAPDQPQDRGGQQ